MARFKPEDRKFDVEVEKKERNIFIPQERKTNIESIVHQKMLMTSHLTKSVDEWVAQNTLIAPTPAIITADWHLPFINDEIVDKVFRLAKHLEGGSFIIAGDLFNYDRFSKWPSSGPETDWQDEKMSAREIFKELMNIQKKMGFTIYYFGGNHEDRIWNMLGHREDFTTIVDQIVEVGKIGKFIRYTNFQHLYLFPEPIRYEIEKGKRKVGDLSENEKEYCWIVCHPKNYSRMPGGTPRRICSIENMNVICAHAHHLAFNYAENGIYKGIDCGCMTERRRHPYVRIKKGTHPKWNPGFAIVNKKGEGAIIGKGLIPYMNI